MINIHILAHEATTSNGISWSLSPQAVDDQYEVYKRVVDEQKAKGLDAALYRFSTPVPAHLDLDEVDEYVNLHGWALCACHGVTYGIKPVAEPDEEDE